MSDETTAPVAAADPEDETSESSRIAGVIVLLVLSGVAVLVLKAVVTAAPYVAYFVVGVIVDQGWHRARAWFGRRRGAKDDDADEEQPDVAEALRHLGRRGDSVLLTQLRKQLRAADTKTVRALLKEEGIRVRSGVRTPAGNGPGVHHEDIPAPPPEEESGHPDRCCCTSEPTTPTPTTDGEGSGEGLRVVPLGNEAKIVYDPQDTIRHHRVQ